MELHAKRVRAQLNLFKPIMTSCSLEASRKGQDKLGELMTALHRSEIMAKGHDFQRFQGAWIMPQDQRRSGVVLYLHGGGYTCGSLEYAKGFSSVLAAECGVRVFCAAYRLAPVSRGAGGRTGGVSVPIKKGLRGPPDPAVRRECRRWADLRPVPEAEGAGAAPALRPHRHFALDGSHRQRQTL